MIVRGVAATAGAACASAGMGGALISVSELLSSCIDANLRGCEIIREFRLRGGGGGSRSGSAGSALTADGSGSSHHPRLKVEGDPRSVVTLADLEAQAAIVG